jgi:hypothetical protein
MIVSSVIEDSFSYRRSGIPHNNGFHADSHTTRVARNGLRSGTGDSSAQVEMSFDASASSSLAPLVETIPEDLSANAQRRITTQRRRICNQGHGTILRKRPKKLEHPNCDHGTDFALRVDGVPMNLPSHAHGQGYLDANWLIPELIESVDYRLGPYSADVGDLGLNRNRQRELVSQNRRDNVDQQSYSLYYANDASLIEWARTSIGLRGDLYRFHHRSDLNLIDTNTTNDGILSPKIGLVLGPWGDSELFTNWGPLQSLTRFIARHRTRSGWFAIAAHCGL